MSQTRATVLAIVGVLAGSALLVYVLRNVSPYQADEQLSLTALLSFFAGIFLLAGGAGSLIALTLHRRWPALAGGKRRPRNQSPPAEAALRQGILAGIVTMTLVGLSILRVLDVAVLIVTLLLAGLVEAYVQNRK